MNYPYEPRLCAYCGGSHQGPGPIINDKRTWIPCSECKGTGVEEPGQWDDADDIMERRRDDR